MRFVRAGPGEAAGHRRRETSLRAWSFRHGGFGRNRPDLWTFRPCSATWRATAAQALTLAPPCNSANLTATKGARVQVLVRDNNVDQALKALKKKMQREGIFREMKLRGHYEKPSEKKAREKAEAIRRARKLARKRLQREGLLPMKPKPTPGGPGAGGRSAGPARTPRFG